eukprot:TRINITY_DN6109_c0_g1_i2.p1 TRINITY_DN6109_c0_g1~~TRINITY_DN6109_c0_g1_i2.p1  ORF type:complete len:1093 (+),score=204.46 TRINITY_DN6109_c0_g1_i2:1-3279(+)
MKLRILLVILLAFVQPSVCVNNDLQVEGIDLTVKIYQDIPKHLCGRALANLEALLTSSSYLLQQHTSSPINTISIILPPTLVKTACTANITLNKLQKEPVDILLTDRDPVFGSSPFSVQHGGCGERGRHVILPLDSLVQGENVTDDTIQQLSSSLVSHLYGVFPTHGYSNDSRYPQSYEVGEVVLDNAGCSLKNKLFCTPELYDRETPTKQNLLCNNKSPMEIVSQHPLNTHASSNSTAGTPLFTPSFRYVSHQTTLYILVLDRSAQMGERGRWTNLHNSLHGFITTLSAHDELAVVTYASQARTNLHPTTVTDQNKKGLHGRIPAKASSENSSCHSCGIKRALGLVSESSADLTVIVLVKASDSSDDVSEDIGEATEHKAVSIYGLLVGESSVKDTEKMKIYSISDYTANQQTQFSDALQAVANDISGDEKGYLKFYENEMRNVTNRIIQGKFTVEESVRSNMKVILNTKFKENIEHFELISPSGKENKFPLVERGSIYFDFESESETGIWTFKIALVNAPSIPFPKLTVSSYAMKTLPVTVQLKSWSNVRGASSSQISEPVLLYAEVMQGSLPVSGAEVVAKIGRPGGDTIEVILTDTGTGYPDITAGDGIYSAYFTSFSAQRGLYGVTVTASDGSGSARIPTVSSGTAEECCGSSYPTVSTIPTPPFKRIFMGPSFYVSQGAQFFIKDGIPEMRDIFPPARITDLHVEKHIENSLQVQLSWTAPGGDFAEGKAAAYEIRYSSNKTQLYDQDFKMMAIPGIETSIPHPGESGEIQFTKVQPPLPNEVFYYGLVSIDQAGNRSPVSNLAAVFVREITTEQPTSENNVVNASTHSLPSTVLDSFGDNLLIYIITGGLSGIAILILIIILILMQVSKRKSSKKPCKMELIKEISSPTLIHSSSGLHGILKESNLSVLPEHSSNFSLDYSSYKMGQTQDNGDISWAILPAYSNGGFEKSSETIVDSGFYRAGEVVDNVCEFYEPVAEYGIYQHLARDKKYEQGVGMEDISDNGTSSTDCELSETNSDKRLQKFRDLSKIATGEFHSLIVTSDDWNLKHPSADGESSLSVSGPVSLPHFSEIDFAERRRRRESFV